MTTSCCVHSFLIDFDVELAGMSRFGSFPNHDSSRNSALTAISNWLSRDPSKEALNRFGLRMHASRLGAFGASRAEYLGRSGVHRGGEVHRLATVASTTVAG